MKKMQCLGSSITLWATCAVWTLLFLGLVVLMPSNAEAAFDDPSLYTVESYYYIPAWDAKIHGLTGIHHLDTVTIVYGQSYDMELATPPEVSFPRAEMYHLKSDGTREFENRFFGDYHGFPRYTWDKAGQYEVEIYGFVGSSTVETYLTTMQFSVVLNGGPAPTCSFVASPDTIDSQAGGSALLTWNSTDATEASIDQGIGSVATSGTLTVSPSATTTYAATFVGEYGTTTCTTTVNVPDPIILPLHEKAASLAKQLVGHAEAYLWGGKGWDYDLGEFTTPERILAGYTYYNYDKNSEDTGIGVDCSGLITWAFNRSNDPTAGFNSNYIKYINADGMFRDHQSDPVSEADLRPGDTLTFDWDSDGRMDHVAMYVGESGGYDVVNAGSPAVGIVGRINSNYKLTPGFKGYRRIHQADVALAIKTGSPVDIEVTDPEGNTLGPANTTPSEEEYVREIPGELYYLEGERGHDGRPKDMIIAPTVKDGAYLIKVIPEPGTDPAATYSLSVELNGIETVVVENETIDTIPENGFALELSGGEIENVASTIVVLLENLYQTILELDLASEPRKRNLLSTIESALNWYARDRSDQVVRKLTKVQGDVEKHIADELLPDELADINEQVGQLLILLNA